MLEAENNYKTRLDFFNYVLGGPEPCKADIAVLENDIKTVSADDMEKKIDILTSSALKNRPELIQIQKKIEASEHAKNMYDSYYIWPTFSAGGYYGFTKNDRIRLIPVPRGSYTPDFSQITGDKKWQDTWQVRVAAAYRWGSLLNLDSNSSSSKEQELMMKQGRRSC